MVIIPAVPPPGLTAVTRVPAGIPAPITKSPMLFVIDVPIPCIAVMVFVPLVNVPPKVLRTAVMVIVPLAVAAAEIVIEVDPMVEINAPVGIPVPEMYW